MSKSDRGFHGPKCWIGSAIGGLLIGAVLSAVFVAPSRGPDGPAVVDGAHDEHDEQHVNGHFDDEDSDEHPLPALVSADEFSMPSLGGSHDEDEHQDAHADQSHDETTKHDGAADHHADDHADASHDGDAGHSDGHHDEAAAHDEAGGGHHGPPPHTISLLLCIPFALLLGSIALMPFVNERFWHLHFPDFAFFLGGIVIAYYLFAFTGSYEGTTYGRYALTHAGLEYYSFIALIGGLYVASGGILVDVKRPGSPLTNTCLLAFGAVIANIVGTTGASVLLIRPFMRINKGRLRPIHVVMFIFIVSNCGGCLTPIGDPPLYLGFLKGIPFQWTAMHLWPMWLACVGTLLAIFFVIDMSIGKPEQPEAPSLVDQTAETSNGLGISFRGMSGIVCLGLIIAGVFIDPMLKNHVHGTWLEHKPLGATFQILVATVAYMIANRQIHAVNEFSFFPIKEVGLLFVGIFATMVPALGYLEANGAALGIDSPSKFYWATGALSGVLDNAPTYLNFLQVSFAGTAEHLPLNATGVQTYLENPEYSMELIAISLGAVFFGAMTYIGNGPNFMVRAIAEAGGLRMPSFFGYLARAMVILLPVLGLMWLLFLR